LRVHNIIQIDTISHCILHTMQIKGCDLAPKRNSHNGVLCDLGLVAVLYALIMVNVWSLKIIVHLASCKPESHPCAKVACQLPMKNSVLVTFISEAA
jgi:hypothetical protein